jgi:hypothetical protein
MTQKRRANQFFKRFENAYDKEIILADATSMQMAELFKSKPIEHFQESYWGFINQIQAQFFNRYRKIVGKPLSVEEATNMLQGFLTFLENQMANIAYQRSFYFWLHLVRRIGPMNRDSEGEDYERVLSELNSRAILNLAILKHGRKDPALIEQEFTPDKRHLAYFLKKPLSYEDLIKAYQLEILARKYHSVTALLRRLWKGGSLTLQADLSGYRIQLDQDKDTLFLIDLYDRRLRYVSTLSHFGSITDVVLRAEELLKQAPDYTMLSLRFNAEGYELPDDYFSKFLGSQKSPHINSSIKYRPNYLFLPLTLVDYYRKLKTFERYIIRYHGFTPEELTSFFLALSYENLERVKRLGIAYLYQIHQRAYKIATRATIFDLSSIFRIYLKQLFNSVISNSKAKSLIQRLWDHFTYQPDDHQKIDLWQKRPIKFVIPLHLDYYILDYSFLLQAFGALFEPLAQESGDVGFLKGIDFQSEVKRYLEREIRNYRPWVVPTKLKFNDGTEGDVDCAFIHKGVLFLAECKAFSTSPEFDQGLPFALHSKQQKIDAALKQVDDIAAKISQQLKGRNYELPKEVKFIVPLVLTPFPEYIHTRSDAYFLTLDIPRICTPEELVQYLKHFRIRDCRCLSFIKNVR